MNSKSMLSVMVLSVMVILLCPTIGYAEVTLDGSVGVLVNSGDSVAGGNGFTYNITSDLGQQAGSNLFHSFDKFNIGLGETANFSGPTNISHVVSRVTGGQSSIAGKVSSSIAGASLWLVNPAGVIFTNGASVDVDGTFHLSTADFVEFSDGARYFSNLSATSTLSTGQINSFGFLAESRGTITIDSTRATPGQNDAGSAAPVSHNLNVNSESISIQNADLHAQEIRVRTGSATFGDINVGSSLLETVSGGIFFQGDKVYSVDSVIVASGQNSGVEVRANSLTLEGGSGSSAIRSGELGASGGHIDIVANEINLKNKGELSTSSGGGRDGGDIILNANTILISGDSQIALLAGAGSRAGDITINTADIVFQNNSRLNSSSKFQGSTAGSIEILASAGFGLESGSALIAESDNAGVGGSFSISAATIDISGQATIDVQSLGSGDGDLFQLKALNSITISDQASINASSSGTGNGGTVQLTAPSITLNNVDILGEAIGTGNGGDILFDATSVLISNGSTVNVSSVSTAAEGGDAGIVSITAETVNVTDTEFLLATRGGGTGGSLSIEATDIDLSQTIIEAEADGSGSGGEILMRGSTIDLLSVVVNASGTGAGAGGEILLQGGAITLTNPNINISARGAGSAGDLIATGDSFVATGTGGIFGDTQGSGTGADVQLLTAQTSLVDITLTTSSQGSGPGGEIQIYSADSVVIDGATLDSQARGEGVGGDIDIRTPDMTLLGSGSLNVAGFGSGNAGHIEITAEDVAISGDGALILTASGSGKGGKLTLESGSLTLSDNADITGNVSGDGHGDLLQFNIASLVLRDEAEIASNTRGAGAGGTIDITAREVSIQDLAQITAETLPSGGGDAGLVKIGTSSFVMTGGVINTTTDSAGLGGTVEVLADNIRIGGGGAIESDSLGEGDGGAIILSARESFSLTNAFIEAEAKGGGAGGQIQIQAPDVTLDQDSEINISALSGTGDAGEMTITSTNLTLDSNVIATETLTSGNAGHVTLTADTIISTNAFIQGETLGAGEGADITLAANTITLASTIINSSTEDSGVGGVISFSGETIAIEDGSAIETDALAEGNGGHIIMNALSSFNLRGAIIEAETKGSGLGGRIEIQAPDIFLGQEGEINISALSGTGDAGELTITGTNLTLNNHVIATETLTAGTAGHVTLTADSITGIQSLIQGETLGTGEGADIALLADNISLTETIIDSSTEGPGEGGFIRFTAGDVLIDGSTLITETGGAGHGGNISIVADQLNILNQGNLNGRSSGGSGDAGSIAITTNDLNISEGLITLITNTSGAGGDMVISTETLQLDQSILSASANGNGDAGRIEINASAGTLQNGTIVSSDTTGNGVGGDILINANTLDILSETIITSSATGLSDAGDVSLFVPDTLQVVDAVIQASSAQSGGGSINIQTENRIRIDQSIISASANGVTADSGGGNISIDPQLFTLRRSLIVAQANAGTGGNINLVATKFLADTETLISASSQRGIDGTVEIESPNQAVNPISADLNTGFQELPEFISNNCTSSGLKGRSYLMVDNMNPVRRDPGGYLPDPLSNVSAAVYTKATAGAVKLATSPGC